ncbi:hypothetical protein V1517DRAFT_185739 [Lipomyces orientalis]|uniref:Uncharacterized protein n=1 Tax=Lipomyces orientalis TaxID=1233043 RepID=A0ACC3TIW2_9ASCO
MQVSLFLDNQVVSVGSPLAGIVCITLTEPTRVDDISVRFRGVSVTAQTTHDSKGNSSRTVEEHTHVDIITSLFDSPRGTIVLPGEQILLFTFQVPVFSECTCLALADCEQPCRNGSSGRACQHSAEDAGLVKTGLPPTFHANDDMYVDYRVIATVNRPGIFKAKKSVSSAVTVIPAWVGRASDKLYVRNSENIVTEYKDVIFSARCDKLPEEYFVPGALPKVSGLKRLFSFSSRYSYVDVPLKAEMVLHNNCEASLGDQIPLELYISIQVDDISRITGILNIKLTSLKLVLESTASGYVWQHRVSARDKITILLQQNDLDVPLAPEESENHVPRFRIDDKVFKSLELGQDIVPDFDVMSMEYRHQIGAVIGLSFNDGDSRTLRTSHAFIINPGIFYDLDTQILLPLRPTEVMKNPEEYSH